VKATVVVKSGTTIAATTAEVATTTKKLGHSKHPNTSEAMKH